MENLKNTTVTITIEVPIKEITKAFHSADIDNALEDVVDTLQNIFDTKLGYKLSVVWHTNEDIIYLNTFPQ